MRYKIPSNRVQKWLMIDRFKHLLSFRRYREVLNLLIRLVSPSTEMYPLRLDLLARRHPSRMSYLMSYRWPRGYRLDWMNARFWVSLARAMRGVRSPRLLIDCWLSRTDSKKDGFSNAIRDWKDFKPYQNYDTNDCLTSSDHNDSTTNSATTRHKVTHRDTSSFTYIYRSPTTIKEDITPKPYLKTTSELFKLEDIELLALNDYQSNIQDFSQKIISLQSEVDELKQLIQEMVEKDVADELNDEIIKIQAFWRGCLVCSYLLASGW